MSSIEVHISALEEKQEVLREKIKSEYIHHLPDEELKRLKLLNLHMREEIQRLREALEKEKEREKANAA